MAFRMIDTKIWNDARVRASSPGARLVLLYLMSGPKRTVLPGLLPLGRAGLAEAMGLPAADVSALLDELEERGLVEVDDTAPLIRVPDAPGWDGPVGPKLLKAWVALLADLPPSRLTSRHVTVLQAEARKRCPASDVASTLGYFASNLAPVDTLSPGYSGVGSRAPVSTAPAPATSPAPAPAAAAASAAPVADGRGRPTGSSGSRDPAEPRSSGETEQSIEGKKGRTEPTIDVEPLDPETFREIESLSTFEQNKRFKETPGLLDRVVVTRELAKSAGAAA